MSILPSKRAAFVSGRQSGIGIGSEQGWLSQCGHVANHAADCGSGLSGWFYCPFEMDT